MNAVRRSSIPAGSAKSSNRVTRSFSHEAECGLKRYPFIEIAISPSNRPGLVSNGSIFIEYCDIAGREPRGGQASFELPGGKAV